MCTLQKYHSVEETQLPILTGPSLSVQDFINRNQDLIGMNAYRAQQLLSYRLKQTPITYTSLLDGLALIRAFAPHPDAIDDCHYALLIGRDHCFTRLVCLNQDIDFDESVDYLPARSLNVSGLLTAVSESNSTAVLLASTRDSMSGIFSTDDLAFADEFYDLMEQKGIEVLDWLILTRLENISWFWQLETVGGKAGSESVEGVNWGALTEYGVDQNEFDH